MVSMETAELHWGEGLVVGMAPVGQQVGPSSLPTTSLECRPVRHGQQLRSRLRKSGPRGQC